MTVFSIYAIQILSSFQAFVLLNFWMFFIFLGAKKNDFAQWTGKKVNGRAGFQRQSPFKAFNT